MISPWPPTLGSVLRRSRSTSPSRRHAPWSASLKPSVANRCRARLSSFRPSWSSAEPAGEDGECPGGQRLGLASTTFCRLDLLHLPCSERRHVASEAVALTCWWIGNAYLPGRVRPPPDHCRARRSGPACSVHPSGAQPGKDRRRRASNRAYHRWTEHGTRGKCG